MSKRESSPFFHINRNSADATIRGRYWRGYILKFIQKIFKILPKKGGLASEDLYLLDLKSGEDKSSWAVIPTVGVSPGRRYGHTMVCMKPFVIVFGGVPGNDPTRDVYILNIERSPFMWIKLEYFKEQPPARAYHSAVQCTTGSAKGMMLVFGGRGLDLNALNDTWGLRKHRDGKWDWVKAEYKSEGEVPIPRFQVKKKFFFIKTIFKIAFLSVYELFIFDYWWSKQLYFRCCANRHLRC